MCVIFISSIGSLLLLCSFVLELLILIGQVGNSSFLRKLNFLVARNQSQNLTYTTALWNYCQGNYQGVITSCMKGKPAFNWAQTPSISQALPAKSSSKLVGALFLAMFCLFFVGCGLSFILWILSVPVCFAKRRGLHFSVGTFVFINFLVMLAALVLALVLIISGGKELHSADNNWYTKAGDSLWVTIGAVVALLLATLFYSGSGICAGKNRKAVATDPNVKVEPYTRDVKMQQPSQDPTYIVSNVYVPDNQYQTDVKYTQQSPLPSSPQDVHYNTSKSDYAAVSATGQTVDPYTGKSVQDNEQSQSQYDYQPDPQAAIASTPIVRSDIVPSQTDVVASPTVMSGTVPSQTINTTDSIISGQAPDTAYPNTTTDPTIITTTTPNPAPIKAYLVDENHPATTHPASTPIKAYMMDENPTSIDNSGSNVIYVPTDQGPAVVDHSGISSNLKIVDANGDYIVRP